MRFITRKVNAGFTLIEIAVVIMIIGLLVAGLAQAYTIYIKKTQFDKVEKTYDSVQDGLRDFISSDPNPSDAFVETEGRYPCPASPSAVPLSATHGAEFCPTVTAGNCQNDVCVRTGTDGRLVFVGALPTKTMGVSSQVAIDPYGNRLTYAVTADLTVSGALSGGVTPAGAVTIDPTISGTPITDAHFAIVTHGEDGAGSYTYEGAQHPNACRVGENGDAENCDDDAVFSELERSTAQNADFYDDALAFTLNSGSADLFWDAIAGNPANIRNLNDSGLVWVGPAPDVVTYASKKLVVRGDTEIIGGFKSVDTILASNHIYASGDVRARDLIANNDALIVGKATVEEDLWVNGDVGIGIDTPLSDLHIFDDGAAPRLTIHGGHEISSYLEFAGTGGVGGSEGFEIEYRNNGGDTILRNRYVHGKMIFQTNTANTANTNLVLDHLGNTGVGVAAPNAKLEVAGEIKVGNTGLACSSATRGTQRYNSSTDRMEYCSNAGWRRIGGGVVKSGEASVTHSPTNLTFTLTAEDITPTTVVVATFWTHLTDPDILCTHLYLKKGGTNIASCFSEAMTGGSSPTTSCSIVRGNLTAGTYTLQSSPINATCSSPSSAGGGRIYYAVIN